MRDSFTQNGFVVLEGAVHSDLVDSVLSTYPQVKSYDGSLLHGPDYRMEKNQFEDGKLKNALATIQQITEPSLQPFVNAFFSLYSSEKITQAVSELYDSEAILGQTFFYERNREKGTRVHDDGYFMHNKYDLLTVWIALEDIATSAGPMYVYPGSENLPIPKNEGEFLYNNPDLIEDVPKGHPRYEAVREQKFGSLRRYFMALDTLIEEWELQPITPQLSKGDVLIFNGEILHGSHPPTDPHHSRLSTIGHYLPKEFRFSAQTKTISGCDVVINPRDFY